MSTALAINTYVQNLYQNVLLRTGDTGGVDHWAAQASAGMSAADMAKVFISSAEAQNVTAVLRLYDVFFNRAADSGGLTNWVAALNSGASLLDIARSFSASSEFQARFASASTADYVEATYGNIFGRVSDDAGKAYWVQKIDSGAMSRAEVGLAFTLSDEAHLSTGPATRFTENYLVLRAAGTADPSTSAVEALATQTLATALAEKITSYDVGATQDVAATPTTTTPTTPTTTTTSSTPLVFTLTTFADNFTGASGNDTFNATIDQATAANGSINDNVLDTLSGGSGTDTLNITPIVDVALTSGTAQLSDALFTHVTGIEKIVIATTGAGAQTITTGALFKAAFAAAGVDLATTSSTGTITVDMATGTTFTGAATLTTTSTTGIQTITTGSGAATVVSTSGTGTHNISGAGLTNVTSISTTGAQVITTGAGVGVATVIATSTTGSVTVTTDSGADSVTLTTGDVSPGNQITTNAGNDTITIIASGSAASTIGNTITGGAGADAITLAADASKDTIVIGNTDSGITVATADSIIRFTAATDLLKMGAAGNASAGAGNYVEAAGAVAGFTAALTAANTALATLHGTSAATELYAFQWDATNGYLFDDIDGNGTADQVLVLVGIVGTTISAENIIA